MFRTSTSHGRLTANILYNIGGQAAVLTVTFLAIKLILARLGPDVFGLILFVTGVNPLLLAALDFGLSALITREVAAHVSSRPGQVQRVLRCASTFNYAMFLLGCMFAVFLAQPLAYSWLHLQTLSHEAAAELIRILALGTLTAVPRAFLGAILRGLQRMGVTNVLELALTLGQQVGAALLILLWHGSAVPVVVWFTTAAALATVAYGVLVARAVGYWSIRPGWDSEVAHNLGAQLFHLFGVSAFNTAAQQADRLIMGYLLPVMSAGSYILASSVVSRATFVSVAVYAAALPVFANTLQSRTRSVARSTYLRLQKVQTSLSICVLSGIIYLTTPLLGVVLGHRQARILLIPAAVLALGYFIQATLSMPVAFAVADGRTGTIARAYATGFAVGAPIGYLAIQTWGIVGGSVSFLAFNVVSGIIMMPILSRSSLGVSLGSFLGDTAGVFAIWLLTYGLGFGLLLAYGAEANWLAMGTTWLAETTLVAVVVFRYRMTQDDRSLVLDWVGRGLTRSDATV